MENLKTGDLLLFNYKAGGLFCAFTNFFSNTFNRCSTGFLAVGFCTNFSSSAFATVIAFSIPSKFPGVTVSVDASYFHPTPFIPAISIGSPTIPEPSIDTNEWQPPSTIDV